MQVNTFALQNDLRAVISLDAPVEKGAYFRATVKLYEGRTYFTEAPPIKVARGEVSLRPDTQPGNIAHILHTAWVDYMGDPWNWTEHDRKAEQMLNKAGD